MKKSLILLLFAIVWCANAFAFDSNFISITPTCPQTFPSLGTPVVSQLKSDYSQVTGTASYINENFSVNDYLFVNSTNAQQAVATATQIIASGLTPYSNYSTLFSVEGKTTVYFCTYKSSTYNLPDIPFQQAYSSGSQVAYAFLWVYHRGA